MSKCPNCGSEVKATSKFCWNCGGPLPVSPEETADTGEILYCPNCGEKLQAEMASCPNCHIVLQKYRQENEIVPVSFSSGHKKRSKAIVAVFVVLLMVGGAIGILGRGFETPKEKFISYQQDLLMDHIETVFGGFLDICKSGKLSTDLTLRLEADNAEIDRYLADSSLLLKLDVNKGRLVTNGELSLLGSPVLSGTVTYDKGIVGFSLPEADSNYYEMDLAKVSKRLYGSDLGLGEEQLSGISESEWRSLLKSVQEIVYTVVSDENIQVETKERFELEQLGGTLTGTVYTCTLKAENIEEVLYKTADLLEENEILRRIAQRVGILGYIDGSGLSEREVDQYLWEAAEYLRTHAVSLGTDMEKNGFSWKLCMEKNKVRMIRFGNEYDGDAVIYECKGNISDGLTEVLYRTYGVYGEILCQLYNTCTRKKGIYSGQCFISSDGSNLSLDYETENKKRSVLGIPYGTYALGYGTGGGDALMLSVENGSDGGTDHILTIPDGSYFSSGNGDVRIIVNTTDRGTAKAPDQNGIDISDYSESELYSLGNDLGGRLGQLIENVSPEFLYGYGY